MQSLYRKYRPTSFVEVIGQPHVVTTLQNALAHKRVGHAYLFSGPRGTGKTTIARILAKELGTQPLDVIEIDAASNRGIDEARTLKEKVQVVPAQSPYKVFIIDEVHMLTKEAFNALLKTLEEPPAHAVFVLATTEPEKIPETIISRTQRFDFRKISNEKIKEHLLEIAVKEGAELNNDAAAIIAQSSDGAVRDALSILDQIIHSSEDKKISPEQVREILGLPPLTQVQEIVGSFIAKDAKKGIGDIAKLAESGVDFYLLLAHRAHRECAQPRVQARSALRRCLVGRARG
jgi:DNA polymerase-3 subunit gamma/tau